MTQATVYLTLAVTYELNGVSAADMAASLQRATERAIGAGLLTGDSPAEVETHSMSVATLDVAVEDVDTGALEDHLLQRIMDGDLLLEDIPNRMVRYGLCAPAQFVAEMLERLGNATEENDEAAEVLGTQALPVETKLRYDAFATVIDFDSSPWFSQASEDDILALHEAGWRGGPAAEMLAKFMADIHGAVWCVVDRCRVPQGIADAGDFEVLVDDGSALAWLKQHRKALWARILCADNNVSLVEAQEEEIRGRWDWLDVAGNASACSLETQEAAALDAVDVLGLDA